MTQHHGETERRREGFEARMETGFEWLEAHARQVVAAVAILLLGGGVAALGYEWYQGSSESAQLALDRVEWRYFDGMGASRNDLVPVEPANADRALAAREEALASYESLAGELGGLPGEIAVLRAAGLEIGLGRLEAADARLLAARDELSEDVVRASALRLHGYVLEELERLEEAAQAYEAAAAIEAYPVPEDLWLAAGDVRLRAGDPAGAANALRQVLAVAPEEAERRGLVERIEGLEASLPDTADEAGEPGPE